MTVLIHQRTPNDCSIAAIAMATGISYETVLQAGYESGAYKDGGGTRGLYRVLQQLGYSDDTVNGQPVDFVERHLPYTLSAEYFRDSVWGRRVIFSVDSLNKPGGYHSLYYDGKDIFDPNPMDRKRYTEWKQVLPRSLIIFREGLK